MKHYLTNPSHLLLRAVLKNFLCVVINVPSSIRASMHDHFVAGEVSISTF